MLSTVCSTTKQGNSTVRQRASIPSSNALKRVLVCGAAVIAILTCHWLALGGPQPAASAQSSHTDAASGTEDGRYQAELGRLLDFSDSDLEANRRGNYS